MLPFELLYDIFLYCDNKTLLAYRNNIYIKDIIKKIFLQRSSYIPWTMWVDFSYNTDSFVINSTKIILGKIDSFPDYRQGEILIYRGFGGSVIENCLFLNQLPNLLIKCIGEVDIDISYGDQYSKNFYVVVPTEPEIYDVDKLYLHEINMKSYRYQETFGKESIYLVPIKALYNKNGKFIKII